MATINIVVKLGWILERLARELSNNIPGVEINRTGWPPNSLGEHAITYFMPAHNVRHLPARVEKRGLFVGFFTHGDERARLYHDRFDSCVAMNRQQERLLRELGAKHVTRIRPGTEPPARPVAFGVCGRVYGKKRKGEFLVRDAVAAGFDFRACTSEQGRPPPCRITHPVERRAEFYESIDYLVVTSLDEGGPMPVLEAIAHGVPVIAPDVGWCWEFPVIRYERGSWESLRAVLEALTRPPTWEEWWKRHDRLFAQLGGPEILTR